MKTYSTKKNYLGLEKQYSNFLNSKIAILPIPFEATTSYGKGTSKGPEAIVNASHYVEFFDEELNRELSFEKGICTISELIIKEKKGKTVIEKIYETVKKLIEKEKYVVLLGGEHTVSTGSIKAHFDSFKNLSILQLDAHSDLRYEYEGTKFSHASFASRVLEFSNKITQLGVRAQCIDECKTIKDKKINTFFAYQIKNGHYGNDWDEKVIETLDENVYITLDLDYFDPSAVPSVGTPEPGGFYWDETLRLFKKLSEKRNVVGFDVVELSPVDGHPASDYFAAKLVYKMLNYFIKRNVDE